MAPKLLDFQRLGPPTEAWDTGTLLAAGGALAPSLAVSVLRRRNYIHIYIYIYVYMYIYVYIYIYVHIYIYVSIVEVRIYVHLYGDSNRYRYRHSHVVLMDLGVSENQRPECRPQVVGLSD